MPLSRAWDPKSRDKRRRDVLTKDQNWWPRIVDFRIVCCLQLDLMRPKRIVLQSLAIIGALPFTRFESEFGNLSRPYGTPNLTKLLSLPDGLRSHINDFYYYYSSRLDRFKLTWQPQVNLTPQVGFPFQADMNRVNRLWSWRGVAMGVATVMITGKGRFLATYQRPRRTQLARRIR